MDDASFTRQLRYEFADAEGRAILYSYLLAAALGIIWILLVLFFPAPPNSINLLKEEEPVQIEFKLPALLSPIKTLADVVWRTERRAGMRFLQFPEQQQKQLERWLQRNRLGMSTGYSYAAGF